MMKIKDIMTKKVIAAGPETGVVEVARLLNKFKIHGLPVVDSNNALVGIITESDFFVKSLPNLYLPSYIDFLKKAEFAKRIPKKHKAEADKLVQARARDIMTEDCVYVKADLPVDNLIKLFKRKRIYTIPVLDKNSKVIGVVTLADIIKLI